MKSRKGRREEIKAEEAGEEGETSELVKNRLLEVCMPREDGTGPLGRGPEGWGLGPCGKGERPVANVRGGGMGRRGGMGRGNGMGGGRGMGRGFGRGLGFRRNPDYPPAPVPAEDKSED